jgi:hypothetical protein
MGLGWAWEAPFLTKCKTRSTVSLQASLLSHILIVIWGKLFQTERKQMFLHFRSDNQYWAVNNIYALYTLHFIKLSFTMLSPFYVVWRERSLSFMVGFIWPLYTACGYSVSLTHTHTLVSTVTSSLPFLGGGFQWRTFPFLGVPELCHSNSSQRLNRSGPPVH